VTGLVSRGLSPECERFNAYENCEGSLDNNLVGVTLNCFSPPLMFQIFRDMFQINQQRYLVTWLRVKIALKTCYGPEHPSFKKGCQFVQGCPILILLLYGVDNWKCYLVMKLMDEDL